MSPEPRSILSSRPPARASRLLRAALALAALGCANPFAGSDAAPTPVSASSTTGAEPTAAEAPGRTPRQGRRLEGRDGKAPHPKRPPMQAGAAGSSDVGQAPTVASGSAPATKPATVAMTSDFALPSGKLAGAQPESPGMFRMMAATSSDGLRFRPTGTAIRDQANVPDLVTDARGTLYLYYTAAKIGAVSDALGVALSTDGGRTWAHKAVRIAGTPSPKSVDPDVVRLPDGTFRLYTTGPAGGSAPGISYAEGTDGVNFTHRGYAYAPSGGAMDSTVYKVGSTWHMLALNTRAEPEWHATSADGKVFTQAARTSLSAGGRPVFPSNAVSVGAAARMFAFDLGPALTAFLTSDGTTWRQETGVSFQGSGSSLEGRYIKDAAVAQLPDGSWFAAYVTPIP